MPESDGRIINVALHVHTLYSPCAETRLETIGDYCRTRSINALAVTDHDTTAGAFALQSVIGKRVRVIIGEEIKSREGEIIGLFLKEEIEPGLEARETAERIKEQGGVVYVPHPFDPFKINRLRRAALMDILDLVDIVEVFNAKVVFPVFYAIASNFAKRHGKVGGAGSDAHYLSAIDACLNRVSPFKGPEEFVRNLRDARLVIGRSAPYKSWWVGIKNVLIAEGHVLKRYGRK